MVNDLALVCRECVRNAEEKYAAAKARDAADRARDAADRAIEVSSQKVFILADD